MSELQTKEDYKQYKLVVLMMMVSDTDGEEFLIISELHGGIRNIGILTKKEIRFKDRQQYLILWRTKNGRVYQHQSCS